jgi:hypothetical protein
MKLEESDMRDVPAPTLRAVRSMLDRRTLSLALTALTTGVAMFGHVPEASADAQPKAEVMVIHATKCDKKKVDPAITAAGVPPPSSLGFDCLALLESKTMPLTLNQASKMELPTLPTKRTFQLHYSAKVDNRYKVTASISPADGSSGWWKLADITADPNKPFNVGGIARENGNANGVLVLVVRIVPS